ncbi:cysteine-rich CWC family protein [Azotobacter sp. CWF10]
MVILSARASLCHYPSADLCTGPVRNPSLAPRWCNYCHELENGFSALPLCGNPNICAQANPSQVQATCWCFSKTVSPAVLKAVPVDLRDRACLCPRCLQRLQDETSSDAP